MNSYQKKVNRLILVDETRNSLGFNNESFLYKENNVSSRLSPQWLYGNWCTWRHDVRLYILGTYACIYIYIYIYISNILQHIHICDYGITWKHVCFNIVPVAINSILKLVFRITYCFCYESFSSWFVAIIVVVVFCYVKRYSYVSYHCYHHYCYICC